MIRYLLIVVFLFLNGCFESDEEVKTYDFREYIAPISTQTNFYRVYNENGDYVDKELKYTINENNFTIDDNSEEKVYIIDSSSITLKDQNISYKRYLKEGDKSTQNCIFQKHFDQKSFETVDKGLYTYSDLLEINCTVLDSYDMKLVYYAKDIGIAYRYNIECNNSTTCSEEIWYYIPSLSE